MQKISPLFRQWLLVRAVAAAEGKATVKSLCQQTQVSEKTIRRDLELLRRVGFPLTESVGEFGRKAFSLESTEHAALRFTFDEALALFFCRGAMAAWQGSFFWDAAEQAFAKIRASLGNKVAKYVERVLPRIVPMGLSGNYADKGDLINQLLLAVEENRAIFVTYHSARSTEPVTYDVHPYGVVDHRGSLYLVGLSVQHEEIRHWKLDRMQNVEVTKVIFQRPADFDLQQHLAKSLGIFHGTEPVQVRVRFSSTVARYVQEKRIHASQRLSVQSDGGVIAEFQLSSTPEIKSWVLSFGRHAEVLEPASLRDEIAGELSAALWGYSVGKGSGQRDGHPVASGRLSNRKKSKSKESAT